VIGQNDLHVSAVGGRDPLFNQGPYLLVVGHILFLLLMMSVIGVLQLARTQCAAISLPHVR
jgi:hypothetical protein